MKIDQIPIWARGSRENSSRFFVRLAAIYCSPSGDFSDLARIVGVSRSAVTFWCRHGISKSALAKILIVAPELSSAAAELMNTEKALDELYDPDEYPSRLKEIATDEDDEDDEL